MNSIQRPTELHYALHMTGKPERRDTLDRRQASRGGRRPHDKPGTAPLVLVVGDAREREADCGMILTRLQFAVAPAADVADARRVIDAVHPDLIVAGPSAAEEFRRDQSVAVPIVQFDAATEEGDALVERIRRVLRTRPQTGA